MPIIVFQHSDANRPGRLGLTLRDHSFKLDVRRLDRGDEVPPDFDDVEGVISFGGPQDATQESAWMAREIEYLREAHERALPVVGVCLGHQLLAMALGGTVGNLESPEVGVHDIEILPPGHTDTILSGIAWRAPQVHAHAQHVIEVPPGATVLAKSEASPVQAFRAGLRTYGFQYHFEADAAIVRDIASESSDLLARANLSAEQFAGQYDANAEMVGRLADRLCLNIATYLIPKVATMVG